MILSLNDIADLKKNLYEKFSVQIHFHDSCGGQYFTLENPTDELREHITAFFAKQNMNVLFSENGEHFSVEEVL